MLNKPPEYIPDYENMLKNRSISKSCWRDLCLWVSKAEGTEMEVDITYGKPEFDKRNELIIVGNGSLKINGIVTNVKKENLELDIVNNANNQKFSFGINQKYEHEYCVCLIKNEEESFDQQVVPLDLCFLSLEVGIGRFINNEGLEDWVGWLGTILE